VDVGIALLIVLFLSLYDDARFVRGRAAIKISYVLLCEKREFGAQRISFARSFAMALRSLFNLYGTVIFFLLAEPHYTTPPPSPKSRLIGA
jgi:hypothetical protein